MSALLINTHADAAVAHMENGDWAAALKSLLKAKTYLATRPDSKTGVTELRWNSESIDSLIREVKQQQTAALAATSTGGILQRQKVTYVGEDSDE